MNKTCRDIINSRLHWVNFCYMKWAVLQNNLHNLKSFERSKPAILQNIELCEVQMLCQNCWILDGCPKDVCSREWRGKFIHYFALNMLSRKPWRKLFESCPQKMRSSYFSHKQELWLGLRLELISLPHRRWCTTNEN